MQMSESTIFQCKIVDFSNPSDLTFVLGAQKNRLIETVLLSTYIIIMFWLRNK